MQLIFHTGAHFTEEERILSCLSRNRQMLDAHDVSVPGPRNYSKLLGQIFAAMPHGELAEGASDIVLDTIFDTVPKDRIILSSASFFGIPKRVFRDGMLYPDAPERTNNLVRLFPEHDLEVFMAIRNPATFLPLWSKRCRDARPDELTDLVSLRAIRWSATFLRMRDAAPEVPITIWCNEDAPLVWPQVLREIAGLELGKTVAGSYDLMTEIMSDDGVARFNDYMDKKTNLTEVQIRQVIMVFLEKFAVEGAIEEVIDLPGWTEDLVIELTEIYHEDFLAIQRIPGVRVIAP